MILSDLFHGIYLILALRRERKRKCDGFLFEKMFPIFSELTHFSREIVVSAACTYSLTNFGFPRLCFAGDAFTLPVRRSRLSDTFDTRETLNFIDVSFGSHRENSFEREREAGEPRVAEAQSAFYENVILLPAR